MKNRTKLFIILAITGWIRVLFIVVPLTFAWFGYDKLNNKTEDIPITNDTRIVDSNGSKINSIPIGE